MKYKMYTETHISKHGSVTRCLCILHYTLFRSSECTLHRKHNTENSANKTGIHCQKFASVTPVIRKVQRREFPRDFSGLQSAVRHLFCKILQASGSPNMLSKRSLRQLGRPRLSQSGACRGSGARFHALHSLRGDLSNSAEIRKCRGVRA